MKKTNSKIKGIENKIADRRGVHNKKRNLKRLKKRLSNRKANEFYRRNSKFIPSSWQRQEIILDVPTNFRLREDLIEVINFISLFKSYVKVSNEVNAIVLNMKNVQRIDIGSICLLLSSIKELGINDINVKGNLPNNIKCKDFITDSGYLQHMAKMSLDLRQTINKSNPKSRNLMLMNGKSRTDHRQVGNSIKHAMKLLSGKASHYPNLYGVIGEMNINSVEHAYRKDKHWVFAINKSKSENKIIFTFADNGFGIFRTLKRGFGLKAFESLGLKKQADIVHGMFLEEYSSRFKKQYNRNKGLPAIRDLQIEQKVDNLTVITNNVYINFETGIKVELPNEFSGTFYYWELSLDTYERNNC